MNDLIANSLFYPNIPYNIWSLSRTPVRLQAQSALNQVVSSRVRSRLLKIVWTGAQFRGAKLLMQWGLCLVKVHQSYGVSGWSMALGPGRVGLAEASVLWRPPTYSFLWLVRSVFLSGATITVPSKTMGIWPLWTHSFQDSNISLKRKKVTSCLILPTQR